MKLLLQAMAKFICGAAMVGVLIFLPAGTLSFEKGWLFMGLLFVPMLIAGFVMFFRSPDFLAKRLEVEEAGQVLVVKTERGGLWIKYEFTPD